MRYINLEQLLLKQNTWGKSSELWKNEKLKQDFREYLHNKCWYTEVELTGQDPNIDHFRPKKKIKQFKQYNYNEPLANRGYYWLKNDPNNYRVACVVANRITGEGGKGCFFPLADDSPLLTESGNEQEIPLLLDPCVQKDVELITFFGNQVLPVHQENQQDKTRVEVSAQIYNWIDNNMKIGRAKVWHRVENLLKGYSSKNIPREYCIAELKDLVSKKAQFSACAIACVNCLAPDEIKNELDLSL